MKGTTTRRITTLSALLAINFGGCAITKEDLRGHQENSQVVVVESAYEEVIERITDRATVCFQWSSFGPVTSLVQHQFNPRSRTANVSVMTLASGITRVWLTIDIRAIADNKTEIIAFTPGNTEREKGIKTRVTKDWAENLSKECP